VTYNKGLNQVSHREEAKTMQEVLKIQSSDIAWSSISQISKDLKD